MGRMRGIHGRGSYGSVVSMESIPDVDRYEHRSTDDASTMSTDDRSELLGDVSFSHAHDAHIDDAASGSDGSPLGWPLGSCNDRPSQEPSPVSSNVHSSRDTFMWEEKREKRETELSGWQNPYDVGSIFYIVGV